MKKALYQDLSLFLAHSVVLERESAERFYELAAMMKIHNNDALHALFLELARYSVDHVAEVEAICKSHQLPELKPWEYQWPDADAPENLDYGEVHYLLTPAEALEMVIKVEQSAEAFYRNVGIESDDEVIRRYALEFAAEEHEHAQAARRMKVRLMVTDGAKPDQKVDLDPPGVPE